MKHLNIGDPAPEWTGVNQDGEVLASSDFLGKKLAFYFYPKDNTPGCTMQACNLRDNFSVLQKAGIAIIGISADTEKKHRSFIEKKNLPFPLLADVDKKIIQLFGVWGEKKFMGRTFDGIHRTTFLINEEGTIVDIIEKPKTKAHAEEILERFQQKN